MSTLERFKSRFRTSAQRLDSLATARTEWHGLHPRRGMAASVVGLGDATPVACRSQQGNRRWFVLWFSPLLLGIGAAMITARPLAAQDMESNAALKYWQAFATMPPIGNNLQDKLRRACSEDGYSEPVSGGLVRLIEQSQYALRMLQRGARIRPCDWGVELREDGAKALLPHLAKARDLARVSLIRARYHIEGKRLQEAHADILSAVAIARHVSTDGTIVGLLVGYSIEKNAYKVLAAYLPSLDAEMANAIWADIADLPEMRSMSSALGAEQLFVDWAVEQVGGDGEGRLLDFCETLTTSRQQAEDLLLAGGKRERFLGYLEELRPLYAEAVEIVELPLEEYLPRKQKLDRRLQGNPLSKFVFVDVDQIHQASSVYACYPKLLRAAIDIRAQGKDAAQAHPNLYSDGIFELVSTSADSSTPSFTLRCKGVPQDEDRPVELTVGIAVQ